MPRYHKQTTSSSIPHKQRTNRPRGPPLIVRNPFCVCRSFVQPPFHVFHSCPAPHALPPQASPGRRLNYTCMTPQPTSCPASVLLCPIIHLPFALLRQLPAPLPPCAMLANPLWAAALSPALPAVPPPPLCRRPAPTDLCVTTCFAVLAIPVLAIPVTQCCSISLQRRHMLGPRRCPLDG